MNAEELRERLAAAKAATEAVAERNRRKSGVCGVTFVTGAAATGAEVTWQVYRVPVAGYPRVIKRLDIASPGTVLVTSITEPMPIGTAPALSPEAVSERREAINARVLELQAQHATPEWPAFAGFGIDPRKAVR